MKIGIDLGGSHIAIGVVKRHRKKGNKKDNRRNHNRKCKRISKQI